MSNPMSQLTAYVMANYRLTDFQTRRPWTWLYAGSPQPRTESFAIVGVRIPDDEDEGKPGFTVHIYQMTGG